MKITIDIPDYDPDGGLTCDSVGGTVRVIGDPEGKLGRIEGDRDGMLSLAFACLSIAHNWDKAPEFCHHHMDEHTQLETGSTDLVVQRLKS